MPEHRSFEIVRSQSDLQYSTGITQPTKNIVDIDELPVYIC